MHDPIFPPLISIIATDRFPDQKRCWIQPSEERFNSRACIYVLSTSSYFPPLHVERVNVVVDKNLKIARTHRSSYFRFAMRRGGGGGKREVRAVRRAD